MVAPCEGITGVKWAEELLKLRHLSGLRALPGRPFLPTQGGGEDASFGVYACRGTSVP